MRLLAVTFVVTLIASVVGALWLQYRFQDPAWVTVSRVLRPELDWQSPRYPSLAPFFKAAYALLAEDDRLVYGHRFGSPQRVDPHRLAFGPVGPTRNFEPRPVYYDENGSPVPSNDVASGWAFKHEVSPGAVDVVVSDAVELEQALRSAKAGDHILMLPGAYPVRGASLKILQSGEVDAPIFLRASKFGDVTLEFNMVEGLHVRAPYWVFENLVIRGNCTTDHQCEHAFHIVGDAHATVIRNVMALNFNAAVKVNRQGEAVPDFGLIEDSFLANEWPRNTVRPVTPVDIVAASGWRVTSTVIADFAKAKGNGISYAAFFKGGGAGGVFDRNLVLCEWQHYGGVRLGLSLGGGGTRSPSVCRNGDCSMEHEGGIIRNNIIMNCPNDVGLYLSKAPNTTIHNNILMGTAGVDIRFKESHVTLFNNVLDGRIISRDGGVFEVENNVMSRWKAMILQPVTSSVYRDPGQANFSPVRPKDLQARGTIIRVPYTDFCGDLASLVEPDIGAFQIRTSRYCNDLRESRQ